MDTEKISRTATEKPRNELWNAYNELGKKRTGEFRALLDCNAISYQTFIKDTYKKFDSIVLGRMKVYQEFFKEIDFDSLMQPVKKPARAKKKEANTTENQQFI